MIKPKEIEIQESIFSILENTYNIHPFSVVYTFELVKGGLISITFFLESDLNKLLKIIEYNNLCDKSGILILKDNKTIIISGIGLRILYSTILKK